MHLKSEMEKRNKIAQSQVLELRSTDDRSSNKWGTNIFDKFDFIEKHVGQRKSSNLCSHKTISDSLES